MIGPALCIGAALGYAYGDIVVQLFPGLQLNPIAFAMVATAAMLAGTFHAPLFGAMMILEMTNNYGLLVPVLVRGGAGLCAGAALPARFGLHLRAARRRHSPDAGHLHRGSPAGMKLGDWFVAQLVHDNTTSHL